MSNKNLAALIIGLVMVFWLFSGSISPNQVVADTSQLDANEVVIPLVRARASEASLQKLILEVRGLTQPNRVVEVRAEISGKVEAIPAVKGTQVQAGDLLCQIALDARQTELNEAIAEEQQARLEFDGVKDLGRQGLHSSINIAKSKAALEASRTRVKRAQLALEKTRIVAPFAGVVSAQPVEMGDFMSPGSVCVSLIEIDPILVEGQVAEKNIGAIQLGDEVEVNLITGQQLKGIVSYIAFSPTNETRSYPIEVTISNPAGEVRSGITSEMHVPLGSQQAHLISPASLVLDDQGRMGVRVVGKDNVVAFYTVTILKESEAGIWVGGLPAKVRLITVGQEEVFAGQTVRVNLNALSEGHTDAAATPEIAGKSALSP